jgi:hypothetical protein
MAPEGDGHAIHYSAVPRGTPVYDSNDVQIGTVVEVLDNYREHIFDGVVVQVANGSRHFVDAPEVARTAERAVTLTITRAEVEALPPPESGSPAGAPLGSTLQRLFGGFRRR